MRRWFPAQMMVVLMAVVVVMMMAMIMSNGPVSSSSSSSAFSVVHAGAQEIEEPIPAAADDDTLALHPFQHASSHSRGRTHGADQRDDDDDDNDDRDDEHGNDSKNSNNDDDDDDDLRTTRATLAHHRQLHRQQKSRHLSADAEGGSDDAKDVEDGDDDVVREHKKNSGRQHRDEISSKKHHHGRRSAPIANAERSSVDSLPADSQLNDAQSVGSEVAVVRRAGKADHDDDEDDDDDDDDNDEKANLLHMRDGSVLHHVESDGFLSAFIASIAMILVSELGDKTFFIAAIMAMKHSRALIFSAAISALIFMTVLSAVLGHALPALLSPTLTARLATLLFFFFGIKLLYEGYTMVDDDDGNEEMEEVESELEKKELVAKDLEGNYKKDGKPDALLSALISPIFIQCFTMTFLAEWGDRSQIATIALAAAQDPYGVTLGAIIGHSCCTGLAVLGGKLLASRISERTVTLVGGALFLVFALHSVLQEDIF